MCTTRYHLGEDTFKAKKPVPPEIPRGRDYLTMSLKAVVSIISIFSVSLVIYYALNPSIGPNFFYWPDYQTLTRFTIQPNTDNSTTNISHVAFGIGGSAQTWTKRSHYSNLWWKPNATRGFVFLDKKPDPGTEFKIKYRISSDGTQFLHSSGSDSAVRIARVVVDLFRVGLPDVRWFVMGDDDTVFFTDNLVTVLAKYDHRSMVYVGGNSESVEQDVMHGYDMAFGGGGFAISYPLAVELVRVLDGCLNRYHYFYGSDQRVWACVGELGVSLSREFGFHQIDIRGDLYGLLAAHPMVPLVSLHHLNHVNPLFPNQSQLDSLTTLMNAYEIDPSRTLQQSFCYHHYLKWSLSISWGYTVQLYSTLLSAKKLETPLLTFQTWRSRSDGPFTFNTRPLSPDPCKQPVIFYLDSVEVNDVGETKTTYKKFVVTIVKTCDWRYARAVAIERIVVTAPKMDPGEWHKVPRRHCCDIKSMTNRTMRVRIRQCKQSETIAI